MKSKKRASYKNGVIKMFLLVIIGMVIGGVTGKLYFTFGENMTGVTGSFLVVITKIMLPLLSLITVITVLGGEYCYNRLKKIGVKILETEDYDSVATRRVSRDGEPPIRSWFARKFYQLINKISDADIVDGARDFRFMKREMVDAIVAMGEYNRFSKGIFGWIGFKTYWLPFKNVERVAGETKWNFWKLFKYAIDGIINFSEAPLSIASWAGIGMTFIAFIMMVIVIVRRLCFGDPVAGWASTMCVIIFIGAIQLFSMGIMGQYIAKTYNETKHRPHYIVAESNGEKVKRNK